MKLQVFGAWIAQAPLVGESSERRMQFALRQCEPADSEHGGEIWHYYLPEVVTETMGGWQTIDIPNAVLPKIQKLRGLGVFDDLYLRVDRGRTDEVVLMGEIDEYAFLLLRWGSDLRSPEEMRLLMYPNYRERRIRRGIVVTIVASLCLSLVVAGICSLLLKGSLLQVLLAVFLGEAALQSHREVKSFRRVLRTFLYAELPEPLSEESIG